MAGERILVVDEEEAIRRIIAAVLQSADYSCREARDGREALALLDSGNEFDLLLSNLRMAMLDGIGLLRRVKHKYPDLPVIMVTAVHDLSVALATIRNGAYDYLPKPFEREQLLAIVGRALENRRRKLEYRAYQKNLEALVSTRTEQLRKAMNELERAYDTTLETLGKALAVKDGETERHCKRATVFTIAIARAMALSKEEISVTARGAFLHDIGKLAIPETILRKPGALTIEEMACMREHSLRGYEMVKDIPFLAESAEIVYCHHERYNGTGYPRGLKGEQIPLGARIVSVANTLDVITSDQPYLPAQSLEAARMEIQRSSGTQFDPDVVKTLLTMPDSTWQNLRREINEQIYAFTHKKGANNP